MADNTIEVIQETTEVIEVVERGPQGYAQGFPDGGTTGQIIVKTSDEDYETGWEDFPGYTVADDGWIYHLNNDGTPEEPSQGDWRQQLQDHPTLPDVRISVRERYESTTWNVISEEGLGSISSNGFILSEATEGFAYLSDTSPLETLINVAPGIDGATVGSTTGDTAIISEVGPFALCFDPNETETESSNVGDDEYYTYDWNEEYGCYYYEFEFTEELTTIDVGIAFEIDDLGDNVGSKFRVVSALPDGSAYLQSCSLTAFQVGEGQELVEGTNTVYWERKGPVQAGVARIFQIFCDKPLQVRGQYFGDWFVPYARRLHHESQLNVLFNVPWWTEGDYEEGDWIVEGPALYTNKSKILVCNTTSTQSGSFADNAEYWDVLGTTSTNKVVK